MQEVKFVCELPSVAENLQFLVHDLESKVQERTEAFLAANVELEENKNSLQLLLDSTAEGIYGIDLDGKCVFCNLSAIRLLGYNNQKELLGKNMHQQIHHSCPDGSVIPVEECSILRSIKVGKGFTTDDEVFWKADGTSFNVSYYSYPQIRGGKVTGGVITFMDITESKHQEEQIEYLRCHDPLTGLNNRGCLEENYANFDVPENLPISVIFADLNGLKLTNDIFGHAAGDELIKTAARILRQSCRKGDVAARVGGDEFLVVLPDTDALQAEAIMSLIRERFSDARVEAMQCSISLGGATKTSPSETLENVIADAENEMYKYKSKNRKADNKDMVETIQEALHAKSPREAQHSVFVRDYCRALGLALKVSETEISKLQRVAYLHDIGKIILDKELFTKDWLTDEEYELFKQHPVVGYRILNLFDDTLDLAEYVYSHHERWDGTGYPRGLKGEQIPYLSRILSVVEAFERVYERGTCSDKERLQNAIRVIRECAGTQFDPDIAHVFVCLMDKGNG
jgi:diguanylate cyclase (GGDEF)-like protein/PAS domain S-box-containing protein